MTYRTLRAAGFAAALSLAGSLAQAATLDFTFSFENVANGGDTVTGIVRGLQDDATSAATSVEVLTNPLGFGIGEYVGNPPLNGFTLIDGSITDFVFYSVGNSNSPPAQTAASLRMEVGQVGLTDSPFFVDSSNTGVTFTRVEPVPIPLPATGLLLAGGVAALAAASRRRDRRCSGIGDWRLRRGANSFPGS